MSTQPDLIFERTEDDIVIATMNRPHARNSLSFDLWEGFGRMLTELEDGSPARALVLCGAGNFFSSGGDTKIPPARGDGALRLGKRLELCQRVLMRLQALPIPTLAAVEGGAWGAAWSLALSCDLLFAAEGAKFGAPFVDLGIVPDGGLAWQLVHQLGRRKASDILLSSRTLGARECFDLQLASHLVPDGTAVEAALAYARSMGKGNRQALELAKRMIAQAETASMAECMAAELAYCHITQGGEELARARAELAARAAAKKQG